MDRFTIVAHRGFAASYPENTMAAMQAAVDQGVCHLELDIQLTRDGVPVLLHDSSFDRTCDVSGSVFDRDLSELSQIVAGESKRLGGGFSDERIPTLETFLQWLSQDSARHVYVEIKDESLEHFGYGEVMARVLPLVKVFSEQVTIIGYDLEFLLTLRRHGWNGIGWVLTHFNDAEKVLAEKHSPDVIICNFQKVNAALWQGAWRWMFYEVTDANIARRLVKDGASYIETMEVAGLVSSLSTEEWQ